MKKYKDAYVFVVTEVSKTIDMYAFLFNDILLLTKIKKPPRKVCLLFALSVCR